jgi:DnaJ-domain-containing protein 1
MRLAIKSTKFISFLINQGKARAGNLRGAQLVIVRHQSFSSGDQRARARKFSPTNCFYKTLNVSADASFEEIRKSYLTLAKQLHPDVNTGNPAQEVL